MAMTRNVVSFLAVLAMIMSVAKAASYTVGDSDGWSTGVDYTAWAAKYTFQVDDKLVFTYLLNHDVVEVSKPDYDACSISSPIATYSGGSTTITLTKSGNRYFICGTPGHCSQGQQLAVETLASSSSPPPPAAVTPPPPPSSTPGTSPPPPSSTPGTPPPPPSSTTKTPPPPATPPPPPSSANKISYGASFGIALIMLAAIFVSFLDVLKAINSNISLTKLYPKYVS